MAGAGGASRFSVGSSWLGGGCIPSFEGFLGGLWEQSRHPMQPCRVCREGSGALTRKARVEMVWRWWFEILTLQTLAVCFGFANSLQGNLMATGSAAGEGDHSGTCKVRKGGGGTVDPLHPSKACGRARTDPDLSQQHHGARKRFPKDTFPNSPQAAFPSWYPLVLLCPSSTQNFPAQGSAPCPGPAHLLGWR